MFSGDSGQYGIYATLKGGFPCSSQIHGLTNNEVLDEKAISALLPSSVTTQLL